MRFSSSAIFFSELPENEYLPKKGVLRLYITLDEYYGVNLDDFEKLNIQKGFKVLYDEDEEKFEIDNQATEIQSIHKHALLLSIQSDRTVHKKKSHGP